MKTVKSILNHIIPIGVFLILVFTDWMNPFAEYIPAIWTISIIWAIFYNLRYRNGKVISELRIRTKNDDYYQILPFIIGPIILVGGICAFIFINQYLAFTSLMILNGFLLLISGFLFVPSGIIEVKNDVLRLKNETQINKVWIEEILNFELKPEGIILTQTNQRKFYLNHMNLNESDYQNITDFLNLRLNKKIEIKTYGKNLRSICVVGTACPESIGNPT